MLKHTMQGFGVALPACHFVWALKVKCVCAGKKFPLEQANEAIAESEREGRGAKVFLEG